MPSPYPYPTPTPIPNLPLPLTPNQARGFVAGGGGSNGGVTQQLALPMHDFTSCPPLYPMGTGLQYVDIEVTVDAASYPTPLGVTPLVSPRLVTSLTGPSSHYDDESERAGFPLTEVPGSPGYWRGTISTLQRPATAMPPMPLELLVEDRRYESDRGEDSWVREAGLQQTNSGGLFNGMQCEYGGSEDGTGHMRATRKVLIPATGAPASLSLCYGDCHDLTLCPCPIGSYRAAGALECTACPVPAGCDWPYAECTKPEDAVCGVRMGSACNASAVKTVALSFAVFGASSSPDSLPLADGSWNTAATCASCWDAASNMVRGVGRYCECIARHQVAMMQASFDELLPGKVQFVLANYQEWLDKPKLHVMQQVQHAELVKLENDRSVMVRKGMVNIAIGKDIGGPDSDGTRGTTWLSTIVNEKSSPVAVVRADLTAGEQSMTHEVGHIIGFPHVAGLGAGYMQRYGPGLTQGGGSGCGLELTYPNYATPSCHSNIMGSWGKAGCTAAESYGPGFNTNEHGDPFSKILACYVSDSNSGSNPDCIGGFMDGDGCQEGSCLGNNQCECSIGWRKIKGSCNVCDFGYTWSNSAWACVEAGSAKCEDLCSRDDTSPLLCETCIDALCAPGCGDQIKGDGICQERCNTAACQFDNGDCTGGLASQGWATDFCHNAWVGDGVCDVACHRHNGDGGDCDTNSLGVCYEEPTAAAAAAGGRRLLEAPSAATAATAMRDPVSGRAYTSSSSSASSSVAVPGAGGPKAKADRARKRAVEPDLSGLISVLKPYAF